MTYAQLSKAYNQTCSGPHYPVLIALNSLHKPLIVELFLGGMEPKKAEETRKAMMSANWNLFKGSMMVFREDIPLDVLRGWFIGNYRGDGIKRGLLKEVQFGE